MDYNFKSINEFFDKISLSPVQRSEIMILIVKIQNTSYLEGMEYMEKTMKEAYAEALKNS